MNQPIDDKEAAPIAGMARQSELIAALGYAWQPIETAPKNAARVLLYYPPIPPFTQERMVVGYWKTDKYLKKPIPYWSHDKERIMGKQEGKSRKPTHWLPLIAPKP